MALCQSQIRFSATDHNDRLTLPLTAIFVKSHVKKWLFSLSTGALVWVQKLVNLGKLALRDILDILGLHRRPALQPSGPSSTHSAIELGEISKMLQWQMAATWILIDFKSSEVGTLKTCSLQFSSVQPTRACSESISNVNISFCT